MSTISPENKPPTRRALAGKLGITERRVSQLHTDHGMPIDSLEAAIAWRESKSAGDSAERLRLARIALVNEQRERHQIENRVRRGELVEAGQVEADVMAMVSRARGEFLKLSSDLPPRLHGLDEAKMSLIIRAEIIEVLTRLSDETAALAALNPPVEK